MKKSNLLLTSIAICMVSASAQTVKELPFKYEEISSPRFSEAVARAGGVCIIPLGIIEKHGPHLPLGTDLYEAREIAFTAALKEYAIVFPPYFAGQIFEARHQPGTIAYSTELMWKMLEETCNELARNGLKKIILLNGHGGNNAFLQFFCQSQLSKPEKFTAVLFQPGPDAGLDREINSLKKAKSDGHAGEEETSMMYFIRPDLVDMDAAGNESGLDQEKLKALKYGYTAIWWYAKFPNHFAGDVVRADKRLGQLLIEKDAKQLAELVRFLKNDNSVEKLQDEFFEKTASPVKR